LDPVGVLVLARGERRPQKAHYSVVSHVLLVR